MALDLSGLTQDQQIAKAAAYAGVPESVVRGQWRVESGNGTAKRDASGVIRSSAGARGDFQVMPETQATWEARTGKRYDVTNFQDNLEMYSHIMRENMQLAKGDITTALRIYHGGTNRKNWGPNNEAYAPAVLGGAMPAVARNPAVPNNIDMGAAWTGGSQMTNRTWSGASIPDAWVGAPIEGSDLLGRATKEHIGKLRAGIAELSLGQNAQDGGTAEQGVARAQTVRQSDQVVPWWVRQEVEALNTEARGALLRETDRQIQPMRNEAEFRDSLSALDKWGAAFDSGIGAALMRRNMQETVVNPDGWRYDPKEWEKDWMTADELEDIRDSAYSLGELQYNSDRIYMRRQSMRVKDAQGVWSSFGYDLAAGFTDPGNWAIGGVTAGSAKLLGVGSAAFVAEGRGAAALGSAVAENIAGSVVTDALLVGAGERRNFGDFLTDAAFASALGGLMQVPGIRSAATLRDRAALELSQSNAAMYGEAWNTDLRARAVSELGEDANPVMLNNRVHQLAKSEMLDWLRAGMADVPDDFRVFARPDVDATAQPNTASATGQTAADFQNVDPNTGKYNVEVGGVAPMDSVDPLLSRAWKVAGLRNDMGEVFKYLESNRAVPDDFRAIANALKRSGRLQGVRVLPEAELNRWFGGNQQVAGGYNPAENAMSLRSSAHSPQVILHEMLHASTFRALREDKAFSDQMEELLMHVNNSIGSIDSSLTTQFMEGRINQKQGGFLSSADELISYGLTNREVQAALRQMPAPAGAAQPTAWEWLKDKIARVLGLKDQESALERLMSVVGEQLGVEVRDTQAASRQTRGMLANSIFKSNKERKAFYERTGLNTSVSDDAARVQIAEVIARAERFSSQYQIDAAKLSTIMQKFDLQATSTTLLSSQSVVARMLGATLLENPEGAAGRHATAAMDRHGRFEVYMGTRPRQWEAAYRLWRADERGMGAIKDFVTGWKARSDFEYAVKLYRETRYMGGDMEVHPAVRDMANELDRGYNRMAQEQRAAGTVGSQRLPDGDVAGYESRTWLGGTIAAAGRVRREGIRTALRDQFSVMGEMYGDDFLDKFATKYLERIEERAAGINRAPDNLYSDSQADTLRDTLRALSLNEQEIQQVMGKYSRGGAKHTKSRIDLDVTKKYVDEDGEFRLMDYLDNRVMDNYRKYAGRVAGDVALAKHGILGDAGINIARQAMRLTGANDVELRAFDQVMSEFTGRVVGTGDPTVLANARLLTSAIQLGGAGINQAAEYSNGLAAVGAAGVAEAVSIAPRMRGEIMRILKGEESGNDILTGFEFISGRGFGLAGYDLHMFNSVDTQASMYGSERAGFFTALAQKASHANRILSGQRAVLAVQQRGFAEVLIAKGVKFLRDGTEADIALKDMGLDDVLLNKLRATQDQVVTWGADGKLEAVDPRKVDTLEDRQAWLAFYNAIDRGTSQILQDTFIGETGKWAHNGWLKMLFQHRTFSLVAQQKQLGRYVGNYGAWKTAGLIAAAMAVAAPLQALRVASRVALMDEAERDEAIEQNILSPLALGKATLNYVSATGMLNDVLEVGTGVAGGWYEYAADTEAPGWLKQLSGGQFGNRKEVIGGQFAPSLGVVNDFAQGVAGKPENLADVLPGGRNPVILPLLKGAASNWESEE
jgi:hypothetical protein